MNQERWRRLKEIVADALEEDSPAARTALLNRECAGDVKLLEEAESFLANADTVALEGTDRLEECAAVATTAVRREQIFTPGRRVGAYLIIRELGRGGMATVYLAARADGYFEKQVAIKVLKPAEAQATELVGRFRAEREVLASLDHPNIAELFDAGTTEEGMPYFVMEYVSGSPITSYVRDRHLSVKEQLQLFLRICSAVEAAHRKRIVHRDLKRNNIIVSEDGEPKLLDFGIAKLLEDNPLAQTATGQQRLTPISASPEQARGEEVTMASDIYALGALLYEMLTGQTPHRFPRPQPKLDEVERVICEEAPVVPSAAATDPEIQRALRGDLDAIILRALQKDPTKRYPSVTDFETDIRHYLAGEPVRARAYTLPYRLLRFAGRHQPSFVRLGIGAAAIVLAAGLVFFFVSRQQKKAASAPPPREPPQISAQSIAVLPFDDFAAADGSSYFADGVQDDILTDLAKAEDLKVISRSGASAYREGVRDVRQIRQDLGVAYVLEGSVRRQADRVRVNVQLIDTASDTQVWAEQYERKLDDLFALQSELSQAIAAQLKGKLSASEKAAMESRPTANMAAYDLYLRAKADVGQYEYEEAIKLLNEAISRDPNFALAHCLLTDAHLYLYRFTRAQSESHFEKAKEAAETALRLAPNLPEAHLAKAQFYYNGLRDFEKALAELAMASPPSPDSRAKFFDLSALAERRLGHWKEALRDGEKALELDPRDPFISTQAIQTYSALRRYRDAERVADRAIKLIPVKSSQFWCLRADAILAQGDVERAKAAMKGAPEDEMQHAQLARIALYKRDLPEAWNEFEAARQTVKGEAPLYDVMQATVAQLQGDVEKSGQYFEKARVVLEAMRQQHPEDPWAPAYLAWVYGGLGRREDAMRASAESVHLIPSWRDAMDGPIYANMQAQLQAWLGEKDEPIDYLAAMATKPGAPSVGELKMDVGWDKLRGDPRFGALLANASKPIQIN
jgi:serine/threonine protein kinase/predicted Zn-dependent protease